MKRIHIILIVTALSLLNYQYVKAQWSSSEIKQAYTQFYEGAKNNYKVSDRSAHEFATCLVEKLQVKYPDRKNISLQEYKRSFIELGKTCTSPKFKSELIVAWDNISYTLFDGIDKTEGLSVVNKRTIIECIKQKLKSKYPYGLNAEVVKREQSIIIQCIKSDSRN